MFWLLLVDEALSTFEDDYQTVLCPMQCLHFYYATILIGCNTGLASQLLTQKGIKNEIHVNISLCRTNRYVNFSLKGLGLGSSQVMLHSSRQTPA